MVLTARACGLPQQTFIEALDHLLSSADWVAVGDLPGLDVEYVGSFRGRCSPLSLLHKAHHLDTRPMLPLSRNQISLATVLYDANLVFKRPATEDELEDAAFAEGDEA